MRNKLFILICFIFMFGFSMNVWAAPASNPGDVPYYFEMNGDKAEKLLKSICSNDTGFDTCQVYYKSKGEWWETTYSDQMNFSDIEYFTFSEAYGGDNKFSGYTSPEARFKEVLKSVTCDNGDDCYEYFSLKYCGDGKNKFTKNIAVCNALKGVDGESSEGDNGRTINCKTSFDVVSKDSAYSKISLYLSHDKNIADDISVSYDDPTNARVGLTTGHSGKFSKDLNNYYFYPIDSDWASFKGELLKKWSDSGFKCNASLGKFCLGREDKKNHYSWYLELDSKECENEDKYNSLLSQGVGDDAKGVEYNVEYKDYTGELLTKTPWKTLSCSDIIPEGSKTQELLKTIINMIKIAVPVLLLIFGVIDFGSAIFAQEEGNIKKAQGKFIKRLIIAVIIFLIPSILNVILSIAHTVWPNISPDFCGIL